MALSIQQPWAWLIVNGHKDVENRTWETRCRGRIYVHAGQKFDREGYIWARLNFQKIEMPEPREFQMGGIVGEVTIVDCVTDYPSPWFGGPYGFVLRDPTETEFRQCRGRLGFFIPEFGG